MRSHFFFHLWLVLTLAVDVGSVRAEPTADAAQSDTNPPTAKTSQAKPSAGNLSAGNPRATVRDAGKAKKLGDAVRRVRTDPQKADSELKEIGDADPLLIDVITYYRAMAVIEDDPARARRRLESVVANPDSVVAPKAAAALAGILFEAGDAGALEKLAERYARGTEDSGDSATVAMFTGKALRDTDADGAAEYFMSVRRQVPGTRQGKEARTALDDLRKAKPDLAPSGGEALYDEAVLAGREGDLGRQALVLDSLISKHTGHSRHDDAVMLRARVIASQKGRAEAADWLDTRIRAGAGSAKLEARMTFAAATHRWNAHESTRALAQFERVIAMNTGISEEQRAWYAIGRIHESKRRYNAAAAAYRESSKGIDGELMRESKWRAGWSSYMAGNFEGAAWVFGAIADSARLTRGVATGREEALYWEARSLERAGRMPEATGVYRTLLEEIPDGFYAYLVEERTGMKAKAPTVRLLQQNTDSLPAQTVRALDRAWILEQAGLHGLAIAELKRAAAGAEPDVRRAILPGLMEIGAYDLALRTSLNLYRRGLLEEDELYPFLYPHAYADIVAGTADEMGIDPFLVYSLIRQESLFDPWAVSPASAYGLMQLLLPTAQRVAPKAGIRNVELDDLFRPATNIRLGIAYLNSLSRRFKGSEVLMLASYNAGERAAERWQERLAGLDDDEFIEQISYRETRNYVKKILRNYRNYRRLYGDAAAQGDTDPSSFGPTAATASQAGASAIDRGQQPPR